MLVNRLFILLITIFILSDAQAGVILVKNGNKTIKQAIASAEVGDTVLIESGVYKEGTLFIHKPITIIGKNWPVIDGEMKYEIISIFSDDVTIKNLKIINSGQNDLQEPCGIKVYGQQNVIIENNQFENTYFGIYLQNSKHCIIRDNKLKAFGVTEQSIGNGIHCWKSDSLQIIGNNISGHRDGIYFEFVQHALIWRNVAFKNIRYGLHFMFSNDDAYISNVFRENGSGVAVMYSKRVTMIGNTFKINWGGASYGLLLKEISDSYISGNVFDRNTAGMLMEGTNRFQVENNLFLNNGWALKITASSMDNKINNNTFIGNTFDATTNGTVVLNEFINNYWDKYEGYDLDKNGIGDVPFHPLSMFAMLTEQTPAAMFLYRSFMVTLLDRSEKVMPSLTPESFVDEKPVIKPLFKL